MLAYGHIAVAPRFLVTMELSHLHRLVEAKTASHGNSIPGTKHDVLLACTTAYPAGESGKQHSKTEERLGVHSRGSFFPGTTNLRVSIT